MAVRSAFLELPPELRQRIYSLYLESDKPFNIIPREPALSLASRQLRAEIIPLYYERFPLLARASVKCHSYGNRYLTTDKWYHRLDPAKVACIRTIKLRFGFMERYFGEPVTIEFTVLLSKARRSYTICHNFGPGWYSDVSRKGDPADCEEVVCLLRKNITDALNGMINSSGIGRLTAKDIDSLIEFDPYRLP